MRRFVLDWASFLVVLAIVVVPAWLGLHFRHFLPYLGFVAVFSVGAVAWLRLTRRNGGETDD
ncbi:hypothetical protein OB2597_19501 [Pseudooceanicola batsensis HTCC2597]|uniref:Uncharacterized protein n=1 Tax=Pseudooceanicola batsensis (strain ATCC BAA-863 / DSM 15984 / KCTC 12145 / HTCC2597) TaxID=252305 RepID=A3U0L0_PSEBH|nr:hypothetical protein [Pseudooceanicola batsensis]EAQ02301.1 hypothetical protein OB2597_19501 [Pseudooceanicola batsensis HTCC2597]